MIARGVCGSPSPENTTVLGLDITRARLAADSSILVVVFIVNQPSLRVAGFGGFTLSRD
jgi:hypothetical protein